jgi:hypothetical protein
LQERKRAAQARGGQAAGNGRVSLPGAPAPPHHRHGAGKYVREDVTTNGIESVFAVLKRGLIGVYHHASPKHLDRYVDEFSFRLNEGNVKNHTLTRLDSFVGRDLIRF